jgi:hypothetical protein
MFYVQWFWCAWSFRWSGVSNLSSHFSYTSSSNTGTLLLYKWMLLETKRKNKRVKTPFIVFLAVWPFVCNLYLLCTYVNWILW